MKRGQNLKRNLQGDKFSDFFSFLMALCEEEAPFGDCMAANLAKNSDRNLFFLVQRTEKRRLCELENEWDSVGRRGESKGRWSLIYEPHKSWVHFWVALVCKRPKAA